MSQAAHPTGSDKRDPEAALARVTPKRLCNANSVHLLVRSNLLLEEDD